MFVKNLDSTTIEFKSTFRKIFPRIETAEWSVDMSRNDFIEKKHLSQAIFCN